VAALVYVRQTIRHVQEFDLLVAVSTAYLDLVCGNSASDALCHYVHRHFHRRPIRLFSLASSLRYCKSDVVSRRTFAIRPRAALYHWDDAATYAYYRLYTCHCCFSCRFYYWKTLAIEVNTTSAAGNREVKVSLNYIRFKQQVREKLRSEEGYALMVRRMIEPESVFGQMKNNRGFRRFLLRGLPKVSLEVGWLSLAHNLLKKAAIRQKSIAVGRG
jgi:uncharacterized protein (DUF2132 family)